MGLRQLLQRLRTRPASGARVELRPLEQVVVAYLIRVGGAGMAAVQDVIDGRQAVLHRTAQEILAPILEQGLAEARLRPDTGSSDAIFVPTAKGLRLKDRLPENPTTVTDFWV